MMMNPKHVLKGDRDNVVVVTVLKDGETEASKEMLFGDAKEELRSCGVMPETNVATKAIPLLPGWGIGDALTYFANHAAFGYSASAHLIIGAQGIEGKALQAGAKMSSLGSIAQQCLSKVKIPVTIVKAAWGTRDGDRDAFGRPVRAGRDGNKKTGLHLVVCIDGSPIGDKALDLATSLCREGDSMTAVHVATPDNHEATQLCESKYGAECGKIEMSKKLAKCQFVKVLPGRDNSISHALIDASEEADIFIMGSIELVDMKKRHVLGSIAMHIAKNASAHMCIVKAFN